MTRIIDKVQRKMKTNRTSFGYRFFVFAYRISSFFFKGLDLKNLFRLPEDKLLKEATNINRKRPFKIPANRKFFYEDEMIEARFHCLKIQSRREKSKKAILILYGGGYILAPMKNDLKLATDIAKRTASDVWFPYYPLCNEHGIRTTFEMAYEVYRHMLQSYPAQNISFVGWSSGASLTIGICQHNNVRKGTLPQPRMIIAVSPGACPFSEAEKEKMEQLSKHDIMVDVAFMSTVRKLMEHGEAVPDYMLSAIYGDFSDFPMTHFYYGSKETLYAEAECYKMACDKYRMKYEFHIGQGLCHCYAMLPYFPEGKRAFWEIIDCLTY